MKKQTIFTEEYVAPEFEVISAVVEAGFVASLEAVVEDEWGEI